MRQQIEKYHAGTLDTEKIRLLEEIGQDWLFPYEREWERGFASAERYFYENGNLNVPTTYKDETGFGLSLWVQRMRKKRGELKTSGANGNQVQRLESIGMQWDDSAVNKKEKRSYKANETGYAAL